MCTCACVCVYIYIYTTNLLVSSSEKQVHSIVYACIYVYVCVCVYSTTIWLVLAENMYVCVCMFVDMYAFVCLYMHVCIYVLFSSLSWDFIHTHIHIHIYTYSSSNLSFWKACWMSWRTSMKLPLHIHTHIHIYSQTYTHIQPFEFVFLESLLDELADVLYIHACIRIYIHTHIRIHIFTYSPSFCFSGKLVGWVGGPLWIFLYTYIHILVYIYIYIYTYIHIQPFEFVLLESLLDELADFYESSLGRTEDLVQDNLDKLTSGSTDEVCVYLCVRVCMYVVAVCMGTVH